LHRFFLTVFLLYAAEHPFLGCGAQNPMVWEMNPAEKIYSRSNVSAYTALSQTLVGDNLDVWILDSIAENLSRPRIHLLPFLILPK